ncbi:uncharacterized protein LOC131623304 [Vicia villosa]|uniref:uncharacterized protein LOC131623304 n=1 Tax=Vicia villosa TaxID=3911 RepID=UPI00273C7781|nr:uncharacterized protein LOC131623304 [Vicia villosa]
MEQEDDKSPPFWLPKTNNHRRLRRSYSIFLTSTSFLVLLFITALVFALVVVPTLRSFSSILFKPQTVKHSWDYLNLILVLFAVVCGFLTKNDTNETQTMQTHTPRFDRSFSNPDTPPSWYENSNRSFNRLRSVGSYPDLRQPSELVTDDERYRFYDDTYVHFRHRFSRLEDEVQVHSETVTSGEVCLSPMRKPEMKPVQDCGIEDVRERVYEVETIEKPEINYSVTENSLPLPPPPLPPLQPLSVLRKKKTRSASTENAATVSYEEFSSSVLEQIPAVRKKKTRSASTENAATVNYEEFSSPMPEPELNLHSPPPVMTRTKPVRRNVNRAYQSEMIDKFERNDFVAQSSQPPPAVAPPLTAERKIGIPVKKKRGNATKEFLTSLRGKKKKQRQKSVENFETFQYTSQPSLYVSLPPPPPPPSVFQNMFYANKSKHKKHYHVPVATYKPQLPNKREHSNYRLEKNVVITGNESPLIPIPPPPPPPPFKLPAWKFRVQGDYVRVDSIGSSRSGSPDSDENVESPISRDESSSNSPYAGDGEESVTEIGNASEASMFCPSPDVDTKAHNFILNFRAGLRMAKMNSLREKQGIGRSNLGPIQK